MYDINDFFWSEKDIYNNVCLSSLSKKIEIEIWLYGWVDCYFWYWSLDENLWVDGYIGPADNFLIFPAPILVISAPILVNCWAVHFTVAHFLIFPAPILVIPAPILVNFWAVHFTVAHFLIFPAPVLVNCFAVRFAVAHFLIFPAPILVIPAPVLVIPAPLIFYWSSVQFPCSSRQYFSHIFFCDSHIL